MLSHRQKILLANIIKEHIRTAQAVSSGTLVSKYKLKVSPATVRSEMMELEQAGYIYQPHISAGRLPTVMAYQWFSQQIIANNQNKKLSGQMSTSLNKVFKKDELAFKSTAKIIAEFAHASVFWAFHKNNIYHTGLSQLFSQPEFQQAKDQANVLYSVTEIIDRLEDIIDDIFEDLSIGEHILVGDQNPFGDFLSTVLLKYRYQGADGLFGILGPIRMDYHNNLALVKYLQDKLS